MQLMDSIPLFEVNVTDYNGLSPSVLYGTSGYNHR